MKVRLFTESWNPARAATTSSAAATISSTAATTSSTAATTVSATSYGSYTTANSGKKIQSF